jgi:hypothetical protein
MGTTKVLQIRAVGPRSLQGLEDGETSDIDGAISAILLIKLKNSRRALILFPKRSAPSFTSLNSEHMTTLSKYAT